MGGFQGHEHANVAVFSGDLSPSPFPSFHVAREGLLSRSTYSGGSPKPTKQYLLDYVHWKAIQFRYLSHIDTQIL